MSIRVVSYNVLVPIYADQPDYYYRCERRFLKTDYRWKLIRSQLEQEITSHENTILCLQELSRTLLSKFQEFLYLFNYTLHYRLYGQPYNDHMGVGIAVPASLKVTDISMIRIGDHIRSIVKRRGAHLNVFSWIRSFYGSKAGQDSREAIDPWDTAISRDNILICLQVAMKNKSFCIGTYHMPCLYKIPDVMIIHSSIVKDLMFELAAGRDFILTGDFNMKARSVCYAALTQKDYTDCRFPQSNSYDISYRPNTKQVLKSAYLEMNGKEPAFTNYVHTSGSPVFCETMDYIFFHGRMKVVNVLKLPDHPTGRSYPDETHPSDHLMIAATFHFQ
ncbi:hypothetical protein I4U23_023584 [Adineta vaga]|nr:hypothetical protein I4U23_023584 [Adineta vaga]